MKFGFLRRTVTRLLGCTFLCFIGYLIYNHLFIMQYQHNLEVFSRSGEKLIQVQCQYPNYTSAQPANIIEDDVSMSTLEVIHPEVHEGGKWQPLNCRALQKVALVVPYRDRVKHFRVMLRHMHPFLQKQNISYTLIVVEQEAGLPFNRGMLFNVAFLEEILKGQYDCMIMHDLDMLPEDHRIPYTCTKQPRHLASARSARNYKPNYGTFIGGVLAIMPEQYKNINGFSNLYFGWGTEDDDFYKRIRASNFTVARVPIEIGRFKNVRHTQAEMGNFRLRQKLFSTAFSRSKQEGVNSLNNKLYKVIKREQHKLYTRLLVKLERPAGLTSNRYQTLNDRSV